MDRRQKLYCSGSAILGSDAFAKAAFKSGFHKTEKDSYKISGRYKNDRIQLKNSRKHARSMGGGRIFCRMDFTCCISHHTLAGTQSFVNCE